MDVDELRERFTEDVGEPIVRRDGLFNPNYGYWLEEIIVGAKNTEQQVPPDSIKKMKEHVLVDGHSPGTFVCYSEDYADEGPGIGDFSSVVILLDNGFLVKKPLSSIRFISEEEYDELSQN